MSNQIAIEPTRRLLKEDEAAQILSLEVATLRRWRWSGRGPLFLKLGGAVRYDLADLDAFIEFSRRESTSDPGLGDCKPVTDDEHATSGNRTVL